MHNHRLDTGKTALPLPKADGACCREEGFWRRHAQNFTLNTLRRKLIFGILVASLLAVGNVAVVQALLKQSETIAATVNVAGKMRMLSQRIGLVAMATQLAAILGTAPDEHAVLISQADAQAFEEAFQALHTGGTAFHLSILPVDETQQAHLPGIRRAWLEYREALETLQRSGLSARNGNADPALAMRSIDTIVGSGQRLLSNTETLLDDLVHSAQADQRHAMRLVYGLFAVDVLLLLLASAIVIFRVLRPIQDLERLGNELANGNYAIRLRGFANDELGALAQVLNKSATYTEQLLRELETERDSLKQTRPTLQRAALVYHHTSEAMVVTDADGCVQDINPAFTIITGYTESEIIGRRMNVVSSGSHSAEFYRAMWNSLQSCGRWSGDIVNRRKSGEEFIESLTINTTFNDDGSVNCRIGLFSDVTEKRRKEALTWRRAHFDFLTQLPNRPHFFEKLQAGINRSSQNGLSFALIFLDLDLFKAVNDSLGHEIGDEVLRQVARRLNNSLRESDKVARLGGDEFTLIVQDLRRKEDVEAICVKIIDAVSQPYRLSCGMVHISCSAGVAFYPDDATDPDMLLHYADLAMYEAKDKGRGQYCLFTANMQTSERKRLDLLKDLQSALETGQFVLQYQPIVDMRSGRMLKAEALVRWRHPEHGLIGPEEFIPLAEDTGLILPLGDYVFRQAARQAALWRNDLGVDVCISVNVSPVQFQSDELRPEAWVDTLRELGLTGSAITFEITERLLMEIGNETRARLSAFQEAGFEMALDDFGTGYSSLTYLKSLDIDYIKIDQSFVRHLMPGSEDMALCQAIITMAHQLDMQVIAEGIEAQSQHDLLRAAGCDYGQGYWYSRPVDPDRCAELLKTVRAGGSLVPLRH